MIPPSRKANWTRSAAPALMGLASWLARWPWEWRKRNGGVGQNHRGNLIAAPTGTARTHVDGFADDVADGEREIADHQAGDDSKGGVNDEAENGATDAEEQAAHKTRVRIAGKFAAGNFGAGGAFEFAVHAIVRAIDQRVARGAALRAGFWSVLGGGKLGIGTGRKRAKVGHSAGKVSQRLDIEKANNWRICRAGQREKHYDVRCRVRPSRPEMVAWSCGVALCSMWA